MSIVRCTACGTKFQWSFAEKGKWPEYCDNPKCDTFIGTGKGDDVICLPSIRTARAKSIDKVYHDMEKGSEFRAQAAAEMSGATPEEMSGLKITNMNDRKDAEVAAMPVSNPVSQFMEQNKVGGFQGSRGVGYSGAVQSGPNPNAGARMMTQLRQHQTNLTGGTAVSDRPALETQQPGYRRRG